MSGKLCLPGGYQMITFTKKHFGRVWGRAGGLARQKAGARLAGAAVSYKALAHFATAPGRCAGTE